MSVDLMIWSNHKISWCDSPREILRNFGLQLNKSIDTFHSKERDEIINQTNNPKEIYYYAYTNSMDFNFRDNNEISIRTNYIYCDEIRLLPTSCLINPKGFFTRWTSWKKMVTKEYLKEEPSERHSTYDEYFEKWKSFHAYLKQLVKTLSGNQILYINDLSYQEPEDLFYKGELFETVKSKFQEIGKMELIQRLLSNEIDHEMGQVWFNELVQHEE